MADISAIKVNNREYKIGDDIQRIKVNGREYAIGVDLFKVMVNNVEYDLIDIDSGGEVGLNIVAMPKKVFKIGEKFSLEGLKVKLVTDEGESTDVTSKVKPSIAVGYTFKVGDKGVYKKVTLTYSEAGISETLSYEITIINDIKLAFEWNFNRGSSNSDNTFSWKYKISDIPYAEIKGTNTSYAGNSSYTQTNSVVVVLPLKTGGTEVKTLLNVPMTSTKSVTTTGSITLDFTGNDSKYNLNGEVEIKSLNSFARYTKSSGNITINGIGDYSKEINITENYTTYDYSGCNACVCLGYPGYIEKLLMKAASSQITLLYAMKLAGGTSAVLYEDIGTSYADFSLEDMDWETYNPEYYVWFYPYFSTQYRTLNYKVKYSET